jgi:DNA gyrase subunit A
VRGITLAPGDRVIGMVVTKPGASLLVVTESGMGKRTVLEAYRLQRRGGKGVINIKVTEKTGRVVAVMEVHPGDELMLMTRDGIINRQSVDGIRVIGRNTQGVRLINLGAGDRVMARVVNEDEPPQPIAEGEGGAQELTPSAALEDELGLDEEEGDDLDETLADELEEELGDDPEE